MPPDGDGTGARACLSTSPELHQLDDDGIRQIVGEVEAGSIVVHLPQNVPAVVHADRDDDWVVAAAIAGSANAICTRNRHFYAADVVAYLQRWGIEVVDDLRLLELLRKEEAN